MALVKCKDCGSEMSTDAKKCPKCGANAPRAQGKRLLYAGLALVGLFSLAAICSGNKATNGSAEKPIVFVKESCAEVTRKFDRPTGLTSLQRDAADREKEATWTNYENKWVHWTGTVSTVSQTLGTLAVEVKCRPDTLVSDVMVKFDDKWHDQLLTLREGQKISFKAQLSSYNQTLGLLASDGSLAK